MKELKQFILCNGKVPVAPVGHAIDPHNPVNWMSYAEAKAGAKLMDWGVGFVFTSSDPYWFLDIDHCLVDGKWSEVANIIMNLFPGTCVEVSQSGEGLHLFGKGQVPEHSCKNKQWGVEFYHEGRFVLLNSDISEAVFLEFPGQIPWLVENYFPPGAGGDDTPWMDLPVAEWNGPTNDADLLKKMLGSGGAKAAFGGAASFRDLYEANEAVLAANYPSQNKKDPYDRSSADFALANSLAFWTGKNHERMRTFMNQSALVRGKWTKHKNYLQMTIHGAVNSCQNVYNKTPPPQQEVVVPATDKSDHITPLARSGSQYMPGQQQIEHFKDCIYIKQSHRIMDHKGQMLKPEVFKAVYGGYTFALDAENIKTTKNAFDAFINNQAISFPKVDGTIFQPRLAPHAIVNDDGIVRVNTYIPINVPRKKGDASMFLTHVQKLFPLEEDRNVIMAYMAAVVQYKGYKFQWCPIIQGVEGNGKTILGKILTAAVGDRYTHLPNAADLSGNGLKFTAWLAGKLFIFIEEIYTSDRRELTEPLKVVITNDRIEIQPKGQDQYTGDNVANLFMCSNHKDCIRLTIDGRRYWIHYCPQQTFEDMIKDGLDEAYFDKMWKWLRADGYAIVTDCLMEYKIPDALNPATRCHRAPKSSSKSESIELSRGIVEQHVLEAIEDERSGFKNGYVSSKALNDLLIDIKMDTRISPHRRLAIMESLGYIRHPWLSGGRVNNPVAAEGAKITIYTNLKFGDQPMYASARAKEQYEMAQEYAIPKLEVVK